MTYDLSRCDRCKLRRPEPRKKHCGYCKAILVQRERASSWLRRKHRDKERQYAANQGKTQAARDALSDYREAVKAASQKPQQTCATCRHGKPNPASDSGFECQAGQAMTCKPWSQSPALWAPLTPGRTA